MDVQYFTRRRAGKAAGKNWSRGLRHSFKPEPAATARFAVAAGSGLNEGLPRFDDLGVLRLGEQETPLQQGGVLRWIRR
jgi:hypothetical protein